MFSINFAPVEGVLCSRCNKSMRYDAWRPTGRNSGFSQDPLEQFNLVGMSLEVRIEIDGYQKDIFMQEQIGKYALNRTYSFCWECWLDSMFGV